MGSVHSPPGPGPCKIGASPPSTGPDTRTYGVGLVQTQVHEGQDWTLDSLYTTPVWQRYEYGYAMSQHYGSAMSQ